MCPDAAIFFKPRPKLLLERHRNRQICIKFRQIESSSDDGAATVSVFCNRPAERHPATAPADLSVSRRQLAGCAGIFQQNCAQHWNLKPAIDFSRNCGDNA
jgi:hypothetical protein